MFLHKTATERVSMVKPFLEDKKINTLDKMVITCLTKLLPTRIESAYLIEHLIKRLKPGTLSTRETLANGRLDLLKDVDLLKQVKELANVENLTEQFVENAILNDATKRFKYQIEAQIEEAMKQFMAEQRGSWLNRINEKHEALMKYKKNGQTSTQINHA